jgi:hypothetical protein
LAATATDIDGHALAQRYEALRRDVVNPSACSQDVRGLALLVRRGMAAWMRCVAEPCVRAESASAASSGLATATSRSEARAPGIDQRLVNIVAAMALANATEVFA